MPMTTAHAPHPAVVGLPPKALTAEDWQPNGDDRFYRCFEGENRETATDANYSYGFGVFAGGTQYDDGRIDDGNIDPSVDAPRVHLYEIGDRGPLDATPLSADAGRRLADLLVMAADEVDGWATR